MISAIVHTYNEEKNIARCLSALNFVDEIVLVDMGSTDKTLALAKAFRVKIYNHPYTGFVESARNFGIAKAKGNWVLIVDADEIVPRSLSDHLLSLIKNRSMTDYYRIPRKNIIFGKWIKHSGWWPDYQIRFFQKGKVSWNSQIHGIPQTRGEGIELETKEEFAIVHYHYDSLEQFLERMNRYTSIQAKERYLKNDKFALSMIMLNPVNEFVRRFFMMEGYLDGIHGLSLSLLQSFSELVVVLKLWQLTGFDEEKIKLQEYQKLENKSVRIKKYWLINTLLKYPEYNLNRFFLKLLRKIYS